jgi:hypothetical protein
VNDEALRCVTHEIKWVAGDQSERRHAPWLEHAHVGRADNFNLIHDVLHLLFRNHQINFISHRNILESSKETVSVTRNPNVARLPRLRRADDPSNASIQGQIVRPVKDWNSDL